MFYYLKFFFWNILKALIIGIVTFPIALYILNLTGVKFVGFSATSSAHYIVEINIAFTIYILMIFCKMTKNTSQISKIKKAAINFIRQ